MNIDPQSNVNHVYAQNLAKQNQAGQAQQNADSKGPSQAAGDTLELKALERLRAEPEIRPEVVAKGKELLNDPNFPSQEMVNKIAKLITPFADDE